MSTMNLINLNDYTHFVVTGFYFNSTRKFRKQYKSADGRWAFGINLWRGKVYGYLKSTGKRKLLKSVTN